MAELPHITVSATATLPPRDAYSITVSGAFSPAIHHPFWYRHIGLIDEGELRQTLEDGSLSTSPIGSQLKLGASKISITCQPNQWTIQSESDSSWERMLEFATQVFERLNDTVVTGFALTSQRHIETEFQDVKAALAKRIASLDLGFPTGISLGSTIALNAFEEDFTVVTSVQPSILGERDVYLLYQRQFESPKSSEFGYFDLGPLIKARLDSFIDFANSFAKQAVDSINMTKDERQI